jgi:DNA-directed RNA polymerase subunit RPC12/RpoP
MALVAVGVLLAAASVAWTMLISFPTALAVTLGLVLVYSFSAYYLVGGLVRLRRGEESDPAFVRRRAWLCDLPLVDHKYLYVGRSDAHPEFWRCRRCGHRRYSMPRSAGETMEAPHSATGWIRRVD